MSDALSKFDPTQAIRDRIRAEFVTLVPDDVWQKLVRDEIRHFTQGASDYRGETLSPLHKLVREEMVDLFRGKIREEIQKPEYWMEYDPATGEPVAGAAVRQIIAENLQRIVTAQWGVVVQQAIDQLKFHVGRQS